MNSMQVYGVIMAGGGGTRFWPLSRQKTPKQLLNLSGKDVMVNETIDRLALSINLAGCELANSIDHLQLYNRHILLQQLLLVGVHS